MNQKQFPLTEADWTLVTDEDVTNLSFQVLKGVAEIRFTAGTDKPAYNEAGFRYAQGYGETNKAIADMVSLSGANRAWMRSVDGTAVVIVDHA